MSFLEKFYHNLLLYCLCHSVYIQQNCFATATFTIYTEKTDYNDGRKMLKQTLRMDQIKCNEKYENLKNQYEKLLKTEDLKFELRTLKQSSELLTVFDEKLLYVLIEKATVNSDGSLRMEK